MNRHAQHAHDPLKNNIISDTLATTNPNKEELNQKPTNEEPKVLQKNKKVDKV